MALIEFVVEGGGATSWPERHARGEVPGRWPYGLEWLAADGVEARLEPAPAPTRGDRARALLQRRPRRRTEEGRVALAWNENVAHRLAAARTPAQLHCGIIWASDSWHRLDGRTRAGLRRTFARMESVWVLSPAQLDSLDAMVPTSTPRHVVPFGVDERFFTATPYPERPLLLSVGGDRDRDQETVLEAFKLVRRVRPDAEAVIQSRHPLGDTDGVRVVPSVSHRELRDLYRRASVVAVATRPNLHVSGMTVALEAQATARPVVLTGTPGASAYVEDGVTGHLVPGGSPAAMAELVLALVEDPGSAERMGEAGRAAVERTFTSRALAARLRTAVGIEVRVG